MDVTTIFTVNKVSLATIKAPHPLPKSPFWTIKPSEHVSYIIQQQQAQRRDRVQTATTVASPSVFSRGVAQVHPHVLHQLVLPLESCATDEAAVRVLAPMLVSHQVAAKIARVCKGTRTMLALKRLFACVRSQVCRHVEGTLGGIATQPAGPHLGGNCEQ